MFCNFVLSPWQLWWTCNEFSHAVNWCVHVFNCGMIRENCCQYVKMLHCQNSMSRTHIYIEISCYTKIGQYIVLVHTTNNLWLPLHAYASPCLSGPVQEHFQCIYNVVLTYFNFVHKITRYNFAAFEDVIEQPSMFT